MKGNILKQQVLGEGESALDDTFTEEGEESSGDGCPSTSECMLNKSELDAFDWLKWQILRNGFFF